MQYVYILISTKKDYCYEQCLVSMTSLLKYNPSAEIILLMDDYTYKTLTGFRSEVIQMASEIIVKKFPASTTQKVRSRLLKTSMRKLLKGKFIFLDLDTVIVEKLDITEKMFSDIAMVLDRHELMLKKHPKYRFIHMKANSMNYSVGYENKHFNSGVIYVNDTIPAYRFFELWHKLYQETLKRGIDIDQTSLNEANARMKGIIKELDGTWNVQVNCGLRFISEAKVIHYTPYHPLDKQSIYLDTLPFRLCEERYFKEIKRRGAITSEVVNIINSPKTAFKAVAMIPDDCVAYKLVYSNHMRILKILYIKCNPVYKLFEYIYSRLFFYIFRRA